MSILRERRARALLSLFLCKAWRKHAVGGAGGPTEEYMMIIVQEDAP